MRATPVLPRRLTKSLIACVSQQSRGHVGTDGSAFVAQPEMVYSKFDDVRFGSKTDVEAPRPDVRFTPVRFISCDAKGLRES